MANPPLEGDSTSPTIPGVKGTNSAANGVAVYGESQGFEGVRGVSHAAGHGAVVGFNDQIGGTGVFGTGPGRGVWGQSTGNDYGVVGNSVGGIGVIGTSQNGEGVHGETNSSSTAAMAAYQKNAASGTAAFFAKHMGNLTAGHFEGDVEVTGDIRLKNSDCAEDFDVSEAEQVEPGTVMVINETGALQQSQQAYDRKVAGVVSGAGGFKPGIVLDRQQSQQTRQPIALLGKVYCKVDAQYGAIEVGDLLTTSPTPGHAMKAQDPLKAFGTVIGKALRPFADGRGLIPILIALQ